MEQPDKKIIIPVLHGDGAAADVVDSILSMLSTISIIKENVDFKLIDWSLINRYKNSGVIQEGADAVTEHKVVIKVPGITPDVNDVHDILGIDDLENAKNVLATMQSPNGPLRRAVGPGAMFRRFVALPGYLPWMRQWDKTTIHIARMHVGDEYGAFQREIIEPGNMYAVFEPESGGDPTKELARKFLGKGVFMAYGNDWDMILAYARTCFRYALNHGLNVRLATKNTILKIYDAMWLVAFEMVYEEVKLEMDTAGLKYEHILVDSAAVALGMAKDSEEWLLCLRNFVADVITDLGSVMGSPGMILSEITSEGGDIFVAETGHGTINKKRGKIEDLRFNPYALVQMFARAMEVAGESGVVSVFGQLLSDHTTETLQEHPTDDMAALKGKLHGCSTLDYLRALSKKLM